MFEYFDIHSHLNFSQFDADREALIKKLEQENSATITIGTGLKTSQEAIALAETSPNLFATIGVHPDDDHTDSFVSSLAAFTELIAHPKVVAIGETGLDYAGLPKEEALATAEKARQKKEFEAQIEFAVTHNKPLMIHCRDAYDDAIDILASYQKKYGEKVRGNFHFFTMPVEIAQKCLDIGFTVSFTGPVTYGDQYDEVVKYVPLEKMMAETDAPFAAPAPYRRTRNEPSYVKEVVAKIALVKQIELDVVKKALVQNALKAFSVEAK